MITLNNFSSRQLASTDGFKRKIQNVAKQVCNNPISYYEIVNITETSVEVLLIDEKMYFYKILLYSKNLLDSLNSKYEALRINLNLSADDNILNKIVKSENADLLDEFNGLLSKNLERLNIENSSELNKLEKVVSMDFSISLEKFKYLELAEIIFPFLKTNFANMFKFKIINLGSNFLELLIITNDCKLFQHKIALSNDFNKFINRYISAVISPDKTVKFRKSLLDMSFIEALSITQFDTLLGVEKFDAISFFRFLISKFELNNTSIGCGNEGLKNVYKFFLDTSANEAEAKKKIITYFMDSKTYVDKKTV